jgi:hypothetical protein
MRKKSTYRPKPIIRDTLAWIMEGFQPLTTKPEENVRLRLRNHLAFDGILHGDATATDLNTLVAVSNMTTALARKYGQDWAAEIRAAADAIEAMQIRFYRWKKVQAVAGELDAVRLLLRIHDAQLDACRVQDLEEGIRIARAGERSVAV